VAAKRANEIVGNGSLYWVTRGRVQSRQRVIDIRPFVDDEGISRCDLVLDPELILTVPQPRRPFQGWRYLKPGDAPADLDGAAAGLAEMPSSMRAACRLMRTKVPGAVRLRLDRPDAALPDMPVYVYSARAPARPETVHHILQSYLDAVLQGYLHQYGEEGARGFVLSTDWQDTPVVRDRTEPLYSRHVMLAPEERALIDTVTSGLNMVDDFHEVPLRGDTAPADRL